MQSLCNQTREEVSCACDLFQELTPDEDWTNFFLSVYIYTYIDTQMHLFNK